MYVNLYEGNDTLDASASSVGLVLIGHEGNDAIKGGQGDDIICGDKCMFEC
jgi:Ca2+-binding RTX toxin-like protein